MGEEELWGNPLSLEAQRKGVPSPQSAELAGGPPHTPSPKEKPVYDDH